MKIGIDIDDTTFLTVKSMLKYADIFEEEISGVPTNRDSFGLIKDRYYLKVLYGWDEKTKFEFFDKYYKNVLEECTMLPNADKTIQKLKKEGDTIHFITARLMNIPECDTEEITKNDFFELGLTGRDNSKSNREKVLKYLNLPTYLTTNAMISALNVLVTKDEIKEILEKN